MQIHEEFSGDLHTSSFGPTYWNYVYIYNAASSDARLVFDGSNDSIPEVWTGSANNPTYITGKFAIYIDPNECTRTTITFTGTYQTVIHYITNEQSNGIFIYIDYNYFDIPVEYQNNPISIVDIKNYMGPYSGNVEFAPCYLPGTMIETPAGERAIEELRAGDEIIAYEPAGRIARTIRSIGCGQANVIASAFDDVSGWPVRIHAGALAEGTPYKDMLVTPEHCLFLNGCFVPARMLVNGRSIVYDKTISSFNYFHIDVEPHAIIRADGALSETLIGTGHIDALHNPSGSMPLISAGDWGNAAAPLNTTRSFVEPLYRELEARAALFGGGQSQAVSSRCDDPCLHLMTDTGRYIDRHPGGDGTVRFAIPHAVRSVFIMSRASRACDVHGPFVDDRRILGVLVGRITMEEGGNSTEICSHVQRPELEGWDAEMAGDMRWTTGRAVLPLPERLYEGLASLSIEIRAAGPYLKLQPLNFQSKRLA